MNYLRYNYPLFESNIYDANVGNEDEVASLGTIPVFDLEKKEFVPMDAIKIIKTCNDAVYKMQRDYPYLYLFMAKCKIMYIPAFPSKITDTMCVDDLNNLWINCSYVYHTCKMDSNRVFGILFHEMFHIFFNHLARFSEMYPAEMFAGAKSAYEKANEKANICMDYEVNASMVDDGIVSKDFWTSMNGLYKKEYTGKTWEEIMNEAGDEEYKDWLKRNGFSLDTVEMKLLEAIEKASKVLLDKDSTDDEKRAARKELKRTIDDLLGKEKTGEKTLQDELEELQKTKLGDIGDLGLDIDDLVDDLYKDPEKMSDEEFEKTMADIDKLMNDMDENVEEIGSQFGKSTDDTKKDVDKAREALKDAMKKMKEGGLSKEDKRDLLDKAKDTLEDIISDDVEKAKLKKKREERDAKKEEERKEKFMRTHPLRKIIVVMNNFGQLHNFEIKDSSERGSLISDNTAKLVKECADKLEPLTAYKFSEMDKNDIDSVVDTLSRLKESFLPDLVALIEDETILNKTEEDMQRLLDGVFEFVFKAFDAILNKDLDEDAKGSMVKMAAEKLRIIGKVLKTQKVWRVGDDFKEAYISEMKRLTEKLKKEGPEAVLKELMDKGVIDPKALDEKSRMMWMDLIEKGEVKK